MRSPVPPTTHLAATALPVGHSKWRTRRRNGHSIRQRDRVLGDRFDAGRHDRGFRTSDRAQDVIGIDASAPDKTWSIARIARRTAESIELGRDIRDEESVLDRWHDDIYGIAAREPSKRYDTSLAWKESSPIRCMRANPLLRLLIWCARAISPLVPVLHAHLGGQPALNATETFASFPVQRTEASTVGHTIFTHVTVGGHLSARRSSQLPRQARTTQTRRENS